MSRLFTGRAHEARHTVSDHARHGRLSLLGAGLLLSLLAACGGGGGSADTGATDAAATAGSGAASAAGSASSATSGTGGGTSGTDGGGSTVDTAQGKSVATATHADAWRLLTQATFGPTDADVSKVMASGTAAWVDAQLALSNSSLYLPAWDSGNVAAVAANPSAGTTPSPISSLFFQKAMVANDQLRQRVGFALSQIFVVSSLELKGDKSRAVASYMDMLDNDAFGNYRTLIQDVAMHPAMGLYLSSLKNQKENPATGLMPDQNFAREVMQLMSIGLSQLNADGTKKLGANGAPIDTYSGDDIVGLSKVFTGFSYGGPDTSGQRFTGNPGAQAPDRLSIPMQAYPNFHSTSAKTFLGVTIAAQQTPLPLQDLKTALDTLYNHPNVGPFIGRQLIQRLVTSHPSNAYVARVAAVFNDNGSHVRGDLKAVVRAILLDDEARNPATATTDAYGKVREPLLRVTAWLRAFGAKSDSGSAIVGNTDDPGLALGQTVARAESVFNFYRPGFVAEGSETGARNLTMPELQTTDETSVAGYVNFMATAVAKGLGQFGVNGKATRRDVQPDYTGELGVAGTSANLVDRITAKLLGDGVPDSYKAQLRAASDSIVVPALKANGANQAQVTAALQNRVWAIVLLTLASPEFVVQK